jgi:long-chain acyl-CoA synthetase
VGVPDAYRGEVVAAFVVPKAGQQVDEDELLAFCRTRLSTYKVPRRLALRTALPTSGAGKILRRALREDLGDSTPTP